MPFPRFDRDRIDLKSLEQRKSKVDISCMAEVNPPDQPISPETKDGIDNLANKIINAKNCGAPVILAYGAHLFRNGLSPYIIKLMELGYIQHLVTNGAGAIHDWEMSWHGKTTEDVCEYLQKGQFGIWEETGYFLNLAITAGTADGLGYGEAIARMIYDDAVQIPERETLRKKLSAMLDNLPLEDNFTTSAALLQTIEHANIPSGEINILHPHKQHSLFNNAYRLNIPINVCPGIGYDIIYSHPANNGTSIGEGGVRDFLEFTHSVSNLENGVFLSIGSAVMAPMILEKALSMARNVTIQEGRQLKNFSLTVVDIQPGIWNWNDGEPPKDNPAYYLRFCKSFSRMGGDFQYICLDNRDFIQHLYGAIDPLKE